METASPFIGDNSHLTIEDFEKIFNKYAAKHIWQLWIACGRIDGVFSFHLCTNDKLAWERAKACQVQGVTVYSSLNYN